MTTSVGLILFLGTFFKLTELFGIFLLGWLLVRIFGFLRMFFDAIFSLIK